jgi:hypothetical protein
MGRPRSITRFGNIGQLFGGGDSPLMTSLARLSVLYEDFRMDYTALGEIAKTSGEGTSLEQYRFLYLIRRSITTMYEFQGGLTQLCGEEEFKGAETRMSDLNRTSIDEANKYLQGACSRIKEWRNFIGGHFQSKAARMACEKIAPSTIGGITWQADGKEPMALRLEYAEHLVAGAISGLLKSEDLEAELGHAMNELMGGYTAMQKATFGLVHHFLWPKFG